VADFETVLWPIDELLANDKNPNQGDVGAVMTAIAVDGWHGSVLCQAPTAKRKRPKIFAGEHRWRALTALQTDGMTWPDGSRETYEQLARKVSLPLAGQVPVQLHDISDRVALRKLLADNRASALSTVDERELAELLRSLAADDGLLGSLFDKDDLDEILRSLELNGEQSIARGESASLAERFLLPPFSVLDARRGAWQERKRAWLALGIRSELGRPENLLKMSDAVLGGYAADGHPNRSKPSDSGNDPQFYWKKQIAERKAGRELSTEEFLSDWYEGPDAYVSGTSVFDPVLAEIAYTWFCPPSGRVLDPFAGGSVRGIVAETLGRPYVGIDLSARQVEENERQAQEVGCSPSWLVGDARNAARMLDGAQFDLLFSCPPYFDLEHYSDDPADLSNAGSWPDFGQAYGECLAAASELIADDRFAVLVTGNLRDKSGRLLDLCGLTARIMEERGWQLYNDAILVTAVGSLALRAARVFQLRALCRCHQYVQVFVKGSRERAVDACGPVDVPDMEALLDAAGLFEQDEPA
jgi:hypothetical protein